MNMREWIGRDSRMDEKAVKVEYPFDAETLLRKRKGIRRQLLAQDREWTDKKIAILGGAATDDIQAFMELFLLGEGIRPAFYVSAYNRFWEDAMFDNPALEAFKPDLVFIHTTSRNIQQWPSASMQAAEIDGVLEQQYRRFEAVWDCVAEKYGCPIIQNNFNRPPYRLLGNQDISSRCGRSNFVFRLNGLLYDYAHRHENFFVHDIDYLAAAYGLERWQDAQQWHLYKYAPAVKAVPEFAYSVTRIIKSLYGKNKKVLAVDLDNTLWGGVVGDDGAENLVIGTETPAGEAFTAFQTCLGQLREQGVLLAVNSKNDRQNAEAGLRHPDSVLHPEDFSAIRANWEDKAENLRSIAQELRLGTDSFVFMDDNPAERELVRSCLPEVSVPELGLPDDFCGIIDRAGYFEPTGLTADDLARSGMYRANAARAQAQSGFASYEEYLQSLEMRAVIRDFEPTVLHRVAQLTNKTNQFNLTTKRCSEADIERIAADPQYIRLYGRLEDKFGDNGIVSVVVGRTEGTELHIELWLMSCRVLKRGMEYAMFECLAEDCRARGIQTLRGYYHPTAKNGMVRGFYEELGFTLAAEDAQGNTEWVSRVPERACIHHEIKSIMR